MEGGEGLIDWGKEGGRGCGIFIGLDLSMAMLWLCLRMGGWMDGEGKRGYVV